MKNFIIAYDIFDPKRLRQVKKIVDTYSIGGQKSSMETPLNKQMLKGLVSELLDIVDDEDKINIIKVIGKPILMGKAKALEYENNGVIIL